MIILKGDTHGTFDEVFEFCEEYETTTADVMVILGDAGINYHLDSRDIHLKEALSNLQITLFCVHGNHEERPSNISSYEEKIWHGGIVLYEEEHPNILFAQDGEIYDFDGQKAVVIGGAYSIDKFYRISDGVPWFEDEQPDEAIKTYVEAQLKKVNWRVDFVFSHTAPLSYEPRAAFVSGIDQSTVDKSTEEWLDTIERKLDYDEWYCGHYHVDTNMGKVRILFDDFLEL